jgi:site-specific DNA recombinase
MQMAAIYARVSSEQQREAHTIASQTAALIEWAKTLDLEVPKAWIVEDEGYSGATLERPGLERVRDLAAEGQIQTVLVYSPDRLSRKYAYQILLIEELARHGVETRFLNAPQGATAEDQLLVQFQGMIAEYERAQILERSRRGKRHRARAGEISVLSGAPYGYRYIRKSDEVPASYAVIDTEARVVQQVYDHYTMTGWSIGAITRWLNEQGVPTRKPGTRWERSMVWAMLRNPAYRGTACFGKTRVATRQRVTRPLRLRGGISTRNSANHERPREEWIEIPVPALLDEPTFARAQELLHENKVRARRRTITPSLVQGLVSCRRCGYALSRTSTRSSARLIHYYRCLGSDAWRHLGGPRCDSRPVRQDLLDETVWTEVMRLLEDPTLIQQELDRRLAVARAADPTRQREQALQRDVVRVGKSIERMLTAYQEDLLSLEQLRERMTPLRQRQQALRSELQSIADQTRERATYLRLAETLSAFLARLRAVAETLDIGERQRIVRLVVKEVLVDGDTIVIRHGIPVPSGPPNGGSPQESDASDNVGDGRSYLLRSGRCTAALRRPFLRSRSLPLLQHAGVQPFLDKAHDASVRDSVLDELHKPSVVDGMAGRDRPRSGSLCGASPERSLSRPWPHRARHGALYPSPHSEPGVQVSRTGLPRSHLRLDLVRRSHDGFPRTAARTTSDSRGSTSTAGGAGCVCAALESTAAEPRSECRRVSACSDAIRSTGRSHAASSSADAAGPVASSADASRATPWCAPETCDGSFDSGDESPRTCRGGPFRIHA